MFNFPEGLEPLRRFLTAKHVDVAEIRSARELAWRAQKVAGMTFPNPADPSASVYPLLMNIQKEILRRHPQFANPLKSETRRESATSGKLSKKQKRAASKAPAWVRDIASRKFNPAAERAFRDSRLGTFGPASEVRRIDPEEYLLDKARRSRE